MYIHTHAHTTHTRTYNTHTHIQPLYVWQSESQNCESLLRITFQMVLQKDLFFVLTPFSDKISSFLDTFYVYDAKMRIRCEL